MASPWSAPGWMKDTDSLVQGSLRQEYDEGVRPVLRQVRAGVRARRGPDRLRDPAERAVVRAGGLSRDGLDARPDGRFLGGHLGPALARGGLDDTTILGYDHNWDTTAYPEPIYPDPRAARDVPGTAWHCYGGRSPPSRRPTTTTRTARPS